MGLLSHRMERSEMKPGDHIYTWRAGYTYSHHGIYVGGSKVVHFTRKKEAGTAGLDSAIAVSSLLLSQGGSDECPTFPDCGFQLPDSGVVLTCLDCFLRGGALHRFEYGVPAAAFLAKLRGGTCTTARTDPSDAAVRRAMHLLQNGFGDYDVFENNCEDFALYCKTGLLPAAGGDGDGGTGIGMIGRSGQAASAVGVPLAALFSTPFKLLAAGPLGMAAVTAGVYCAGRYVTDIGVRKDVVKVEVEDLAAHLGWRRAKAQEAAAALKKQQQPEKKKAAAKSLLPLKRKREICV
ncbi:unnamed protein product [Miscanthus lutarioriparius]|uniref:LRAT domain-containing protein n=1 Tax=Miscanthus lutarioriparius TaxID=422564 RepID=A0A811R4I5_9POAL|nr:unnamed protein product [Miscanthus lutarioriparius]